MLTILFGEGKKPTLKQIQKDVMKYARENDLSEMEAGKMLRGQLKKYDIPYPKGMATDTEFKKQLQDKGDKPAKTKKARGGMAYKAKMAMGGMANNKKHMYLNDGAFVTDKLNPGLKALAKERPDVVKKILKKS